MLESFPTNKDTRKVRCQPPASLIRQKCRFAKEHFTIVWSWVDTGRCKNRSMKVARDVTQIGKLHRQILEPIDDHMNDSLRSLQQTRGNDRPGLAADTPIPLPYLQPNDQIDGAGFIFESHECDSFGSTRSLSQENQAGNTIAAVGFHAHERRRWHYALFIQKRAQRSQGMTPER
jgi:hypothetical protein